VHAWVQILVPDNTPFDQFLDANPDAFLSLGDTSEPLLVDDLLTAAARLNGIASGSSAISSVIQRHCIHWRRGEGGAGATPHAAGGTRQPGDPDPLLGADIFFASNLSLKNPAFRSARCGACHNLPTLTDNTVAFTFKAQLPDFASEFSPRRPGLNC